ncbi:hypothetical protein [Sneathiella aquimaris]|uniref:hypothetical protein n=1 Tax=Sneathiella aquimaris TaxID=2599305 RepID=UPI00146EB29B|nr:hypothetical protein [Sneathiella aquimaris]
MPHILDEKAGLLAEGRCGSSQMGVGQFCTNPGVVVAVKGPALDAFKAQSANVRKKAVALRMLTNRNAQA